MDINYKFSKLYFLVASELKNFEFQKINKNSKNFLFRFKFFLPFNIIE